MDAVLEVAVKSFIQSLAENLPKDFTTVLFETLPEPVKKIISSQAPTFAGSEKAELFSIFEYLGDNQPPATPEWIYPFGKISPDSLFPVKKGETPASSEQNKTLLQFRDALGKIRFQSPFVPHLWFENLESLIMLYASGLPASPESEDSDIALYDFAKIQAAFAVADYLQNHSESVDAEAPYLLISGGITGIQNFIFQGYGESRAYRSKLLRGRSFAVTLFTELSAVMLCEKLGLPSISLVFNAAGRFTLLAPNSKKTRDAVDYVRDRVNDWLVKFTYGETLLTFSVVSAAKEDFQSDRLRFLWNKIDREKEASKFSGIDLNRHGGISGKYGDYLDLFTDETDRPLCPLCGKRPSNEKAEKRENDGSSHSSCQLCRDYRFLGQNLVKTVQKDTRFVIFREDADLKSHITKLLEPFFDEYQVAFLNEKEVDKLAEDGAIVRCWDMRTNPSGDMAVKFINGYVPVYTNDDQEEKDRLASLNEKRQKQIVEEIKKDDPKTLELIALNALNPDPARENGFLGVEALGVFKADVDDLGKLMACGLKEDRFTLPRLATLSRQLNNFFALYLPNFLENGENGRFRNVYTVFAGGDDLFLIGPWNRVVDLSVKLRIEFDRYVCHNPNIHFSGGISFHKTHTPIDLMADSAEAELEKSKHFETKNRLTLFSETVLWDQMEKMGRAESPQEKTIDTLQEVRQKLEQWLDEETINSAMLFRLNGLIDMAEKERRLRCQEHCTFEDISCAKWRSRVAYTASRNVGKKLDKDNRKKKIEEVVIKLYKWLDEYGGKLRIPVWNIMYDRR